jgi:hypothetical protein
MGGIHSNITLPINFSQKFYLTFCHIYTPHNICGGFLFIAPIHMDIIMVGLGRGSNFTPKFFSVKWGIIPPFWAYTPYIRVDTQGGEGVWVCHNPHQEGRRGLVNRMPL